MGEILTGVQLRQRRDVHVQHVVHTVEVFILALIKETARTIVSDGSTVVDFFSLRTQVYRYFFDACFCFASFYHSSWYCWVVRHHHVSREKICARGRPGRDTAISKYV